MSAGRRAAIRSKTSACETWACVVEEIFIEFSQFRNLVIAKEGRAYPDQINH